MAALYHGLKPVVHLAYLAYAMWGLMWGPMWGRKRLACGYEKFKKIVHKHYPDLHGPRSALPPPMLAGTHFKVSGYQFMLRCNIRDARCSMRDAWRAVSRSSREPVEP